MHVPPVGDVWVRTLADEGGYRFTMLNPAQIRVEQVRHIRVPCRERGCDGCLLVPPGVDLLRVWCPRHAPVTWRGSA